MTMLAHSLLMKSRKMCSVLSAMHAGHVCGVTNTDCLVQNGSVHGCVIVTFKCLFLTNRMRNGIKNCCV